MSTLAPRPAPPAERRPAAAGAPRRRAWSVGPSWADRRFWIALPVLVVLVAMAVWPDAFDGPGPLPCTLDQSLLGPGADHLFGTDRQGCDLWARAVHGARDSLIVGFGSVGVAVVVAAVLGTLTGVSRFADGVVRMVVDLFIGIPVVLVGVAVLTATERPSPRHLVVVLSFLAWPLLTRVMRTEVHRVRGREYVDAARAMGAGPGHVLARHVAPNAMGAMLSLAILSVATAVTVEAVLTFLGAGLQLPNTSWGILMFEAGRSLSLGFHLALPGLFLVAAVGALVALADVARDARPPS